MLEHLKNFACRHARPILRSDDYPILLPHHRVEGSSLHSLGQPPRAIDAGVAAALTLCDGSLPLSAIAREAGVSRSGLLAEYDRGTFILWPVPRPAAPVVNDHSTAIIISPHLDDAVLGMGIRMLSHNEEGNGARMGSGLVLSVFSRSTWSRFPQIAPEKVQWIREAEEKLAVGLAGWQTRYLEQAEALMRGHTVETVFTADYTDDDRRALESVRERMTQICSTQPEVSWYLPLGTGGHIDHRIARDAALAALGERGVHARDVYFYEALPYAATSAPPRDFSSFERALPPLKALEAVPFVKYLRRKTELLRVYWSQLTLAQIEQVRNYALTVARGERLWQFNLERDDDTVQALLGSAGRT